MIQLNYAITLFLSLLLTSLPFLLLGIFVSSWLLVFVDEHQLAAKFPHNPILGAILGSSLGMIIPVCQYGNIPVTRRLLMQGAPLSVAISFLLASPTVNPIVLWLTWQAFPDYASILFYRLLLAWIIAFIIGLIFSTYREKPASAEELASPRCYLLPSGTFLRPSDESEPLHRIGNLVYEYKTTATFRKSLKISLSLFWQNVVKETLELGGILMVGCAIAALAQMFLPQGQMLTWAQAPVVQISVMILLGVILSLGSPNSAAFLSFFAPTFLKGSLLSFLLFSSVVDLKSVCLLFFVLRFKAALYLIILVLELTILSALILNFYPS
ncbi:permease [Gloeothece verrucosa]|uniref:Permease n=1 Tax=Gloeothece verrucosa (strain PCC 7822) TaxID=497965 RepID=E0UDA3_GLOV7|nr:permease [Gloeothece verrucosa]ADN14094.1 permease [Gloeothece verrucosa PCC 7822]